MIFHAQNLNVCIDAKPEQWQVPSQDLILEAATPYTAQKPRNRNTPQQVNGICRLLKTMYWGYTFPLTKKNLLIWYDNASFPTYVVLVVWYVCSFFFLEICFSITILCSWFSQNAARCFATMNCIELSCVFQMGLFYVIQVWVCCVFFQEGFHVFCNSIYIVASCSYVLFLFCCAIDPRHQKRYIIYRKIVRWKNKIVR